MISYGRSAVIYSRCIIAMVCPSWSGGGCASAMLLITIFLACNCCGHSRSGHEGCICLV